jgi:hypothetical protein
MHRSRPRKSDRPNQATRCDWNKCRPTPNAFASYVDSAARDFYPDRERLAARSSSISLSASTETDASQWASPAGFRTVMRR